MKNSLIAWSEMSKIRWICQKQDQSQTKCFIAITPFSTTSRHFPDLKTNCVCEGIFSLFIRDPIHENVRKKETWQRKFYWSDSNTDKAWWMFSKNHWLIAYPVLLRFLLYFIVFSFWQFWRTFLCKNLCQFMFANSIYTMIQQRKPKLS